MQLSILGTACPGMEGKENPLVCGLVFPSVKRGHPLVFFFILPIGRRSCVASEIRALMCFGFIPCSAKASPFLLAGGSGMYKAETIFAAQQIALASPGRSGSRAHPPPAAAFPLQTWTSAPRATAAASRPAST